MAKEQAPKPLVPVGAGVAYSTPEDAAALAKKAAGAKKAKTNTNKRKKATADIKAGVDSRVPVTFWYADNKTRTIMMVYKQVLRFGVLLPKNVKNATEANVKLAGSKIKGRQRGLDTKQIFVSYGRKIVKRKKDSRNGAKGADVSTQAWHGLSVPKDAILEDILQFIGTWRKQPAIIRYGQQDVMISQQRAILPEPAYSGVK